LRFKKVTREKRLQLAIMTRFSVSLLRKRILGLDLSEGICLQEKRIGGGKRQRLEMTARACVPDGKYGGRSRT
jgi:hypothetical protein